MGRKWTDDAWHAGSNAAALASERTTTPNVRFFYIRMHASVDGAMIAYDERLAIEARSWNMSQYDDALTAARELSRDYRSFMVCVDLLDNTHCEHVPSVRNRVARYSNGNRVG